MHRVGRNNLGWGSAISTFGTTALKGRSEGEGFMDFVTVDYQKNVTKAQICLTSFIDNP